eukprot:scaffold4011_cov197-Ochromonas_danica.AAC.26
MSTAIYFMMHSVLLGIVSLFGANSSCAGQRPAGISTFTSYFNPFQQVGSFHCAAIFINKSNQ